MMQPIWHKPTVTRSFGPLGNFRLQMERFKLKTAAQLDVVIRKTGLDVLSSVVAGEPHGDRGTPVDIGTARGGWQVEVQSAGATEIPTAQSGRVDKTGAETIAAGAASIAKATRHNSVVIFNNVEYIQVLEYGRDDGRPGSPQAPNGMVRVALRAFPNMVEEAAAESQTSVGGA